MRAECRNRATQGGDIWIDRRQVYGIELGFFGADDRKQGRTKGHNPKPDQGQHFLAANATTVEGGDFCDNAPIGRL